MKKSDINQGQPYVYDGRYVRSDTPTYVVTTDAIVYQRRNHRDGETLYLRSSGTKPQASTFISSSDQGYPVVVLKQDTPELRAKAAAITLDDFLSATKAPEGLRFEIILTLGKLVGPFDEWHEEQKQRRAAAEQAEKKRRERIRASLVRYNSVAERLLAVGVTSVTPENLERFHADEKRRTYVSVEDLELLVGLAELVAEVKGLKKHVDAIRATTDIDDERAASIELESAVEDLLNKLNEKEV